MSQDQILEILDKSKLWFNARLLESKLKYKRTCINKQLKQLAKFNLIQYRITKEFHNDTIYLVYEYKIIDNFENQL